MRVSDAKTAYEELGVRKVINAMGSVTLLGGSTLSPSVLAAMADANAHYVEMEELLEHSGRAIASLLGAEAALVTSGAFAALALSAAAIMTGKHADRIARLPDTAGMRTEFLIPAPMRYRYDRCVSVAGGRLRPVGDETATTIADLEAAIGPQTVGVLYLAKADGMPGIPPLREVVSAARTRGVAVVVDAAAEVYPLDRMAWLAGQSEADLVCFGAKYFGAPQSAGIVCGRREAVEAVTLNNFGAYETLDNRGFGRGYKVDRQEVAATVVALREWFALDHGERFAAQERRLETVAGALNGLAHIQTGSPWERQGPWLRLRIAVDEASMGKKAAEIGQELRNGTPSIRVRVEGSELVVAVHTLNDGEDRIVAERLRKALS